ncbi:unnamed protein product [Prunus brigantina]
MSLLEGSPFMGGGLLLGVWNQSLAAPRIVIANTLHIRASPALYRIMALLKCLKWLSGSESPLNGVMDGVVNRFGGEACSISSVKDEQSTQSISLHRASSVLPLSRRPRSWSFTSFPTSFACMNGGRSGRRLRCLERDWLTSSSAPKGRSPWLPCPWDR